MLQSTKFYCSLILIAVLSVTGLTGSSIASTPGSTVPLPSHRQDMSSLSKQTDRDVNRIVHVLESRLKDRRLPAKVRNKLAAMDGEELRLVTMLCDRIAGTGESAGADLALMLVTALIVLS